MASGVNTATHSQIDELTETYLSWTSDSLAQLFVMLDRVKDGSADSPDINGDLHGIAHNIKGMGSSFGFPLMTHVGTSLCSYLRGFEDGSGGWSEIADAGILEAHLEAMRKIIDDRISGDGESKGARLLEHLEELTRKV